MIMNNKGVSTSAVLILIAIVFVAVVVAAFSLGSSPATVNNGDITVYIDGVQETGNYTAPQNLAWANTVAGNTYTKNFTVANTGAQPFNLLLLTTEPAGNTQTWAYNNTVLNANNYAAGSLTLTLSTSASAGAYTWRLFATNSSIVMPTATPAPDATPTPNGLSYTITAQTGIQNLTITRNQQPPFVLLPSDLPATYTFTAGDNLKLQAGTDQYFTFNGWQFADGSMPQMNNPIILANIQGNFTVTAKALMTQP